MSHGLSFLNPIDDISVPILSIELPIFVDLSFCFGRVRELEALALYESREKTYWISPVTCRLCCQHGILFIFHSQFEYFLRCFPFISIVIKMKIFVNIFMQINGQARQSHRKITRTPERRKSWKDSEAAKKFIIYNFDMAMGQLDSCKQWNIKKLSQTCLVPLRLACLAVSFADARRSEAKGATRETKARAIKTKTSNKKKETERREVAARKKQSVYRNNKKEARQKAGHMFHGAIRQARFKNLKIKKTLALLANHPFPFSALISFFPQLCSAVRLLLFFLFISKEMHKVWHKSYLLDLFVAKGRWRARKQEGAAEVVHNERCSYTSRRVRFEGRSCKLTVKVARLFVSRDFPRVLVLLATHFFACYASFCHGSSQRDGSITLTAKRSQKVPVPLPGYDGFFLRLEARPICRYEKFLLPQNWVLTRIRFEYFVAMEQNLASNW